MNLSIRVDRRIVIIVLAGLLLSLLAQVGFASRQSAAVTKAQATQVSEQAKLSALQGRVQRLREAGVVDSSSLLERVDVLYGALPETLDDFHVLEVIETTAQQAGLVVDRLERGDEGSAKTPTGVELKYVDYTLSIAGSVDALVPWLADRLGDPDLVVSIESASVSGRSESGVAGAASLSGGYAAMNVTLRVWFSGLAPLDTAATPRPAAPTTVPSAPVTVPQGATTLPPATTTP